MSDLDGDESTTILAEKSPCWRDLTKRDAAVMEPSRMKTKIIWASIGFAISTNGLTLYSDHGIVVGRGYVAVPYATKYDLPRSAPFIGSEDESEVYGTSSVHQLHCLVSSVQ